MTIGETDHWWNWPSAKLTIGDHQRNWSAVKVTIGEAYHQRNWPSAKLTIGETGHQRNWPSVKLPVTCVYHWQELPRVSFFVATNTCLSRETFFSSNKIRLLSQKYACRHKKRCEYHFCRDKTNIFCRDKHTFVAEKKTRVLSRQKLYLWQLPPMICAMAAKSSRAGVQQQISEVMSN